MQPSLSGPPSEPQTSMQMAQSSLEPPTERGHHGLCCILAFFFRRCGVPRLPGVAAPLLFLSLGVVLPTEALLRSTGANAVREERVLRRCM